MNDEAVGQRLKVAMSTSFTGASLAMYRDDLVNGRCKVVDVDVRGEEDFVRIRFSDGSVSAYAHECDVPAPLLEAMYLGIAAGLGLLAVPRH